MPAGAGLSEVGHFLKMSAVVVAIVSAQLPIVDAIWPKRRVAEYHIKGNSSGSHLK